jgi:hypothetical protein
LHLESLRTRALEHGKKLGVPVVEAIAACTLGPALETPAERAFWARAGRTSRCRVSRRPCSRPRTRVGDARDRVRHGRGEGLSDVARIVMRAESMAPALEELIAALAPDLRRAANELGIEEE